MMKAKPVAPKPDVVRVGTDALRASLAEHLHGVPPVLVTDRGRLCAIIIPVHNPGYYAHTGGEEYILRAEKDWKLALEAAKTPPRYL